MGAMVGGRMLVTNRARSSRRPRAPVLLVLALALPSCGTDAVLPPEVPTHAPADGVWWTRVAPGLEVEARAFRGQGATWAAPLPHAGVRAELGAGAVRIVDETTGEEQLSVRLSAWGRTGDPIPAEAVDPELGACTDEIDASGDCVPRVELDHGDLVEWWRGRDDGLAQGWSVSARPRGDGPLVFDIAVDGGAVFADGTYAELTDGDGTVWVVDGLSAWDAGGLPLEIGLSQTATGLRVTVDDADATYPIEVDPVYTTTASQVLGWYSDFGSQLAWADVDGDGYDDLLVGAPSIGNNTGQVRIYRGGPTGVSSTSAFLLRGEESGTKFGTLIVRLGDVNADGFEDVAITAGGFPNNSNAGRVYVFHGGGAGPWWPPARTYTGAAAAGLGTAVAGADVDNDGDVDLIVGAPGFASSRGQVYVYPGSPTGLAAAAGVTLDGVAANDRFGSGVGVTDVDADGFDDVIVGARGYTASIGRAYVYPGGPGGTSVAASRVISAPASTATFGYQVAGGDVNNDGFGDVLIGAPLAASPSVHLYLGSSSGLAATPTSLSSPNSAFGIHVRVYDAGPGFADVTIGSTPNVHVYKGTATGLAFVYTRTTASGFQPAGGFGDANGDGRADLAVGEPNNGWPTNLGKVDVLLGSAGTWASTTPTTILGTAEVPAQSLPCVASGGDVDNDGYDDVLIGSTGSLGKVYLFRGGEHGLPSYASAVRTGTAADAFGAEVSFAGDVNNDGFDDVLIGAPTYLTSTGRAFLYLGNATGLGASAAVTLTGAATDDKFGQVTSDAGDVDQDGYDDVLVASLGYNYASGRVYLFRGNATGVGATPTTVATGSALGALLGAGLAGAGDVNNDGFNDVIIGAPVSATNGQAFVHLGSASGLATTPIATFTGAAAAGKFGNSVAGAGDVNNDGYDDVIVGAPGSGSATGGAFVYLGAASGVSAAPANALTGAAGSRFGNSVAGLGDTNADGRADIVIGAPASGAAAGSVVVYHGAATGVAGTAATTLIDTRLGTEFGAWVGGADIDGDGFGDALVTSNSVLSIYRGYLPVDADADGLPVELDCDDSNGAVGLPTLVRYLDADADGWGASLSAEKLCADAAGYVTKRGDCNDQDANAYPGAVEIVGNGLDDDCKYGESCYADADKDGYRTSETIASADLDCADPGEALVSTPAGDCSDADAAVHPGASEGIADGKDTDCDGGDLCYANVDGDGFRGTATVKSADLDCADTGEAVPATPAGDCDDTRADVWPGATDGPGDGVDGNCDGKETCYVDVDADGHHTSAAAASLDLDCLDVGEVTATAPGDDCDDTRAAVHPTAVEVTADGIDEDCDGAELCYVEADGDGWRLNSTVNSPSLACTAVGVCGTACQAGDCDDSSAKIHPTAAELPGDAVDEDCDGGELCYADVDGDTFRSTSIAVSPDTTCDAVGEAPGTSAIDCADDDASVHPGAVDAAADGVDTNCDGLETCFRDDDGDGHRTTATRSSADSDCTDAGEAGASVPADDCDDTLATVFPGADETIGDEVDEDCDGQESCFGDADGDKSRAPSWVPAVVSVDVDCADSGEASRTAPIDCDESDSKIHPGAVEIHGDGVDADCDGHELCYVDGDRDGYRTDAFAESSDADCDDTRELPASAPDGDCEDSDPNVHPGAAEIEDGQDNDCNGHDEGWDLDEDGLDVIEEREAGTNPRDPDTDGDGVSDGDEVAAGTDPLVAGSDPDTAPDSAPNDTASPPQSCGCASGPRPVPTLTAALLYLALRRRPWRRP